MSDALPGRRGIVGPAAAHRYLVARLGLLAVTFVLAACGASEVGSPASSVAAAPTPRVVVGAASSQPIVVDGGLLSILPARVDGVDMQFAAETAAAMMGDPELGRSASAIVVGLVVSPGDSRGEDLAISTVVQLRPGVFSDAFYRDWRGAYDEAACAQAGGVASHVQQVIGAHTVEVAACSGGARTYHTHLKGDLLVSITTIGDRRFGDLVMAGLRE